MAYLTQSTSDLVTVKRFLYDVRRKWYNIGLELGVEHNKLDEIQDKHGTDYDACLREMLKIWLKFYPNKPTWGHLADALKEQAIDEKELADEGMVAYCIVAFALHDQYLLVVHISWRTPKFE